MDITQRFLKYVSYDTTSEEISASIPSTPGQKVLGAALVEEMQAMGIANARMDTYGYVYGTIPATDPQAPSIGFIAHMDTSPDITGKDVKPRIVKNYDGGDILLNETQQIILSPSDYPILSIYKGQDIIVTDGTTLLGADDKAGIAAILSAAEQILSDSRPHGAVQIGFTPDEEIGRGADHFDIPGFGADYAYTVDGGTIGGLEYENFNAASASVTIHGKNIHPGSAKHKMKNSMLIAIEFNGMLPAFEIPAYTEGYEGFAHLIEMNGSVEKTTLSYILRDHDSDKLEARKQRFSANASFLNEKYGAGTVELTLQDHYRNMKETLAPHMHIIEKAKQAMEQAGITPRIDPIRGGTDGARLSYEGLPCPNIFTGGENMHGRYEFLPIPSLEKCAEVICNIIYGAAK